MHRPVPGSRTHPKAVLLFLLLASAPLYAQYGAPATGAPANGTYSGSLDKLNLGNLNVALTIPLFKKAGRGINYEADLTYNSSLWSIKYGAWAPTSSKAWGWRVGPPLPGVFFA